MIVLEYKDLGNAGSYQPVEGLVADGVGYAQARAHHRRIKQMNRVGTLASLA